MLRITCCICYSDCYMSESITVSTWNLQGALSNPEHTDYVANAIKNQGGSILTLPDAWRVDSEKSERTGRSPQLKDTDFKALGYTYYGTTFPDDRPDDNYAHYGFASLVHESLPVIDFNEIKLGERRAHHLRVDLAGIALNVISLYLDDRGEDIRMRQLDDLSPVLSNHHNEPIVLMGDFNAMHRSSLAARLLRSPGVNKVAQRIPFKNGAASNLVGMGKGDTMARLAGNGFHDADPEHQATMPSSLPLFQLDHIMFRHGLNKRLSVEKPVRTLHAGISDHVQLSTTVAIADSHEHSHH